MAKKIKVTAKKTATRVVKKASGKLPKKAHIKSNKVALSHSRHAFITIDEDDEDEKTKRRPFKVAKKATKKAAKKS